LSRTRLAESTYGYAGLVGSSRVGRPQVREGLIEVHGGLWYTISEISISSRSIGRIAETQVKMAEFTHEHSKSNIYDIITRSSTVRETSSITSNDTKGVLGSTWGDGGLKIKPKHLGGNLVRYGGFVDSR